MATYVRSNGNVMGGQSRLTVVTSASTTAQFTTARIFEVEAAPYGEKLGELLGFALSADGQKVCMGFPQEGLWMASASDLKFTKRSSKSVQCLATRGSELWACSAPVGRLRGRRVDGRRRELHPEAPSRRRPDGTHRVRPEPGGSGVHDGRELVAMRAGVRVLLLLTRARPRPARPRRAMERALLLRRRAASRCPASGAAAAGRCAPASHGHRRGRGAPQAQAQVEAARPGRRR